MKHWKENRIEYIAFGSRENGPPFFSKSIKTLGANDGEPLYPEIFQTDACESLQSFECLKDFVIEIRLKGREISLRTIDWKNEDCVFRHEGIPDRKKTE